MQVRLENQFMCWYIVPSPGLTLWKPLSLLKLIHSAFSQEFAVKLPLKQWCSNMVAGQSWVTWGFYVLIICCENKESTVPNLCCHQKKAEVSSADTLKTTVDQFWLPLITFFGLVQLVGQQCISGASLLVLSIAHDEWHQTSPNWWCCAAKRCIGIYLLKVRSREIFKIIRQAVVPYLGHHCPNRWAAWLPPTFDWIHHYIPPLVLSRRIQRVWPLERGPHAHTVSSSVFLRGEQQLRGVEHRTAQRRVQQK
jgi:hypothetical protein